MRRYYGRLIYFSLIKICVPTWRVALPSICGTSEFELWDAVVKDSWSPLGVAIEVHSFRGQDVSPSNNGSRSFAFAASFGDPGFETLLDCSNSRYPIYQNTQEKDLWTRVGADGCLTLATVLYRHSLDYGPTLGFIPWNYELILDYSSLHPSSLSHAGVLATIKKFALKVSYSYKNYCLDLVFWSYYKRQNQIKAWQSTHRKASITQARACSGYFCFPYW